MNNFFEPEMLERVDRLFKGGFLIIKSDENLSVEIPLAAAVMERLEEVRVGGFSIYVIKESHHFLVEKNGVKFVVIGDIYDNDGADVEDKIRQLADGDILENFAAVDLGGRYALIVIMNDDVLIVNDPFGSRAVHYFIDSKFAVSSHESLLALFFNTQLDQGVEDFRAAPQYQDRTVSYLPGNLSVFKSIRRLPPNHAYMFRSRAIVRYWPHLSVEETTEEQVFVIFERALKALRDYVVRYYNPILSITGGVDSRSIVTTFHENGTPFSGVTWTQVNFNPAEKPVIQAIIDMVGCSHLNVGKVGELGTLFARLGSVNSGGSVKGLRARLMEKTRVETEPQRQNGLPPVFLIGYGGEILRGFYRKSSRDPEKVFDVKTMTALYGTATKKSGSSETYSAFVTAAFGEFSRDSQFDHEALKGFDGNDIFYWEHRMGMWAALTMDTIDVAMPCLVGINSRRLYEAALGLPMQERMSGNLILRYIESRSPALGSIPLK